MIKTLFATTAIATMLNAVSGVQPLSTEPAAPATEITTETTVKVYPDMGVVTDVNSETDIVEVTMFNGESSEFYGAEDWFEGDFVALIMSDNGTPDYIYDDMIIDANYAGYVGQVISNEYGFFLSFPEGGYWYEYDEWKY